MKRLLDAKVTVVSYTSILGFDVFHATLNLCKPMKIMDNALPHFCFKATTYECQLCSYCQPKLMATNDILSSIAELPLIEITDLSL